VTPKTSIASAAHTMVWEGIELLPVVDDNRKLLAVLSRQDVLKAMQYMQKQPQMGETIESAVWNGFEVCRNEDGELAVHGNISPVMIGELGNASETVLAGLMIKTAFQAIRSQKRGDLVLENMTAYFIKPLQIDSEVAIVPKTIEVSRKFGKVEVEVRHDRELIAKAMLTAQLIEQG
jgi:predicted transcriptional regulator